MRNRKLRRLARWGWKIASAAMFLARCTMWLIDHNGCCNLM